MFGLSSRSGRPMSVCKILNAWRAAGVARRTVSVLSTITMGIWMLASRLFRSLLICIISKFRLLNSSFSVVSSSFVDCNSSFAVSNSSLEDCNSSLLDSISSLADFNSSLVDSCSSMTACNDSLEAASSRCSAVISRCPAVLPSACGNLPGRVPLVVSSKITSSHDLSEARTLNGTTSIFTSRIFPSYLTSVRSFRAGLSVLRAR